MPIDLTRTENFEKQAERLSYKRGVHIKNQVNKYLSRYPNYGFTADALAARIQIAATPSQVEIVLSAHPETFSYRFGEDNERLYWSL